MCFGVVPPRWKLELSYPVGGHRCESGATVASLCAVSLLKGEVWLTPTVQMLSANPTSLSPTVLKSVDLLQTIRSFLSLTSLCKSVAKLTVYPHLLVTFPEGQGQVL